MCLCLCVCMSLVIQPWIQIDLYWLKYILNWVDVHGWTVHWIRPNRILFWIFLIFFVCDLSNTYQCKCDFDFACISIYLYTRSSDINGNNITPNMANISIIIIFSALNKVYYQILQFKRVKRKYICIQESAYLQTKYVIKSSSFSYWIDLQSIPRNLLHDIWWKRMRIKTIWSLCQINAKNLSLARIE